MKEKPAENGVLEIDNERLDYELERQANLYGFWAEKLAHAKFALDRRKAKYDLMKAEKALDIRARPKDYGIEKMTEGIIDNTLVADPEVCSCLRRYHQAKLAVDLCEAYVRGLDHKRSALERLVTLQVNNLHSTPLLDRDTRKLYDDMKKSDTRKKTKIKHRRETNGKA